jgi:hypothetical protein
MNRIEVDWLNSYRTNNSTTSVTSNNNYISQVMEVANIIKDDLCESMELYLLVHGRLHPRWDDFSKM